MATYNIANCPDNSASSGRVTLRMKAVWLGSIIAASAECAFVFVIMAFNKLDSRLPAASPPVLRVPTESRHRTRSLHALIRPAETDQDAWVSSPSRTARSPLADLIR